MAWTRSRASWRRQTLAIFWWRLAASCTDAGSIRSGNPVRIIWYGNPNDADSKIAQTGALNNGHIHGKVVATGTLTTKKTEKGSTVELNG